MLGDCAAKDKRVKNATTILSHAAYPAPAVRDHAVMRAQIAADFIVAQFLVKHCFLHHHPLSTDQHSQPNARHPNRHSISSHRFEIKNGGAVNRIQAADAQNIVFNFDQIDYRHPNRVRSPWAA